MQEQIIDTTPEHCSGCGLTRCDCDYELQAEQEEHRYRAMLDAMNRLDLPDTVIMALESMSDKVEDSPLLHLCEMWSINPPMDWSRPSLSPLQAEVIGRWVAIWLARIMGHRLEVLASDATF